MFMDLIKKSVRVIEKSQLKNGGILATPIKGAYPYIYPRDGSVMTVALNKIGETKRSEKFYYFLTKFSRLDNYKEIFHRYNIYGLPAVTRKNQNDNEGMVLWGIYDTYKANGKISFLEDTWPLVEATVSLLKSYSKSGLIKTESSIHEFSKLERGYDIWVNSAGIRGLYDASKIAQVVGKKKEAKEWNDLADKLKKEMKKKLFDSKLGIYMKTGRRKDVPDISQIAPFYFEIEGDEKILKKTLKYLREHLWYEEIGGFRRFRKFEVVDDWHWYTGGSGSWCALTAIMGRLAKRAGEKKLYQECNGWLDGVAERSGGLLPEHIATRDDYELWKMNEIEFNQRLISGSKEAEKLAKIFKENHLIYWATPLGWSHAEYILLCHE